MKRLQPLFALGILGSCAPLSFATDFSAAYPNTCSGDTCVIDTPYTRNDGNSLAAGKTYNSLTINANVTTTGGNPNTLTTGLIINYNINTITNNATLTGIGEGMVVGHRDYVVVGSIINNGTITGNFGIQRQANVTSITNYGTIGAIALDTRQAYSNSTIGTITNHGTIGGVSVGHYSNTIGTIDNRSVISGGISGYGTINSIQNYGDIYHYGTAQNAQYYHIVASGAANYPSSFTISTYKLTLNETATTFNAFSGYTTNSTDTSHLAIYQQAANEVKLASNARILLDISGANFEFGKDYAIGNLITGTHTLTYANGGAVDLFSHLSTTDPIYEIVRNGNYFRIGVDTQKSGGNTIYSNNILTMNTMLMLTQSGIDSRAKLKSAQSPSPTLPQATRSNPQSAAPQAQATQSRQASAQVASQTATRGTNLRNIANRGSRFRNMNNATNTAQNAADFTADSVQDSTIDSTADSAQDSTFSATDSAPITQEAQDNNMNFFFMPFAGHQMINSGIKASGMNYGFVSGINYGFGSSHIGAHIGFSYGNMDNDFVDSNAMAILAGIHAKFGFVYGLYLKARVDALYMVNDVAYNSLGGGDVPSGESKPNALGGNVGAAFGKDWEWRTAQVSLEGGVNYEGLHNKAFVLKSLSEQSFSNNFISLLYADINAQYTQYLLSSKSLALDFMLGAKYLITGLPNTQFNLNDTLFDLDIGIDKILGYAKVGLHWHINEMIAIDFAYIGAFGDNSMNNTGFMNVRVWW